MLSTDTLEYMYLSACTLTSEISNKNHLQEAFSLFLYKSHGQRTTYFFIALYSSNS